MPGEPRVFRPFAGGMNHYRQRCEEEAAAGYPGFGLRPAPPDG